MEANVGAVDRAIRLLIAVVLIGLGLGVVRGPRGIAMAAVGAIPLLSALSGRCPLYTVFGINTCRRSPREP
jgi:hypothetical protein